MEFGSIRALQHEGEHEQALEALEGNQFKQSVWAALLRGLSLTLLDRGGEALPALKAGLAEEPDPEAIAWQSDKGLALLLLGQPLIALPHLEAVVQSSEAIAVDFGRWAAALAAVERYDEAADAYVEAIERQPGRAEWHSNLGGIRARQFRLDEALEQYERALRLKPDSEKIQELRDRVLLALDAPDKLVADRQSAAKEAPLDVGLKVRLARALDLAEQPEEAMAAFKEAITLLESEEPANAEGFTKHQLLAEVAARMQARARYAAALQFLDAAEGAYPDDEEQDKADENAKAFSQRTAIAKAQVLTDSGRAEKALEILDEAAESDPDLNERPRVQLTRASALSETGDYEQAEALLRAAIETYPGNAAALMQLGQTLLWLGRMDEAVEYFERASEIDPNALANLVQAGQIPDDPAAIERMEKMASNPFFADNPRGAMAFSLAKVYEKRKDFDEAFRWLEEANKRTGKTVKYDPEAHSVYIDSLIEAWTPEIFERFAGLGNPSRRPIFVLGMPRSGTTLTESILGSHPDIFPAGELPLMSSIVRKLSRVLKTRTPYPQNLAEFKPRTIEHAARYYLNHVAAIENESPFVVDKMPHNFLHVGLIALLFPNASVIHVNRDPRDSALSNYQQNFKAKHGTLGYSIDLEWTAQHINDYHRLMNHWREVVPIPIFELEYGAMVADQEGTTRQLLHFIGVDWDEGVKDFHKAERAVRTASVTQVRQGIYKTSSQKWRRYADHLGPLLDNLNPELTEPYDELEQRAGKIR